MTIFRVRKEHILNVLGFAEETPDETVVSTINVRLDEMFREVTDDYDNLIIVHANDLEKIGRLWMPPTKYVARKWKFKIKDGLQDNVVTEINCCPAGIAAKLSGLAGMVFCHSPMFCFTRGRGSCEIQIWVQFIAVRAQKTEGSK